MRLVFVLAALLVSACSSPGIIDTGRVKVVDAAALPVPTKVDINSFNRVQMIGPFDTLSVEVVGISDLTRDVTVDASGTIALPVAGVVEASGKTSTELAEVIREKLKNGAVRDPQVIVNVKQAVSQVVVVDGEVRKPGVYAVTGRTTMLRAIAQAEGTNEFSNTSQVVVLRTVNNQRMAALYDVRAIRLGAYEDPEIYPADTIIVGESGARRILPTILQASGVLLTPLVYLLR
jgi:polysaccharide export outer membrane protein